MCFSRVVRAVTSLAIVLSILGCGQKRGRPKKESADSMGSKIASQPPTAGMDSVVKTPAGHFRVDFLGFTQSADAKQRVVRLALRNGTQKTVRSARIVLRYASSTGRPLGEFRLHIVRRLAPGASVEEPADLIGHKGAPEDVAKVTVSVDEVEHTDGTRWKRSPR